MNKILLESISIDVLDKTPKIVLPVTLTLSVCPSQPGVSLPRALYNAIYPVDFSSCLIILASIAEFRPHIYVSTLFNPHLH